MTAVILKPLVTEKSMSLVKSGMFTFLVDKNATKSQIGKAVSGRFAVDVLSVSTVNMKSKTKLQKSRKGYFQKPSFKKAIVQLKKGQKIALFESAEKEEVEVRTAEGEVVGKTTEKKSLLGRTKIKISKLSPVEIEQNTAVKSPPAGRAGQKAKVKSTSKKLKVNKKGAK